MLAVGIEAIACCTAALMVALIPLTAFVTSDIKATNVPFTLGVAVNGEAAVVGINP
jgi:hypothetical protein